MRIALVYDGVYPYSVGGGEKVFRDLATYLSPRHDVHLLGMKLWEGPDEMALEPNVRLHGICAPERPGVLQAGAARSLPQALRFARAVHRALMRLPRFDIVDCMATPYFPLYAARLACARKKTPLVSTWLELWSRAHWRTYVGSAYKARVAHWIESGATRLPRHIIAISEQTAQGLVERGVAPSRVSVVTPWIDMAALEAVPPDENPCDILFAGRLIASKGVDTLIRALAELRATHPGLRCRIVGDGPDRDALAALARENGLESHIAFSGFLPAHQDLVAAMKSARVFVLPSRREGFGIVIVEAAACGLPSITVDAENNAARHLVRESGVGAVCEDNPAALARAVREALDRPAPVAIEDAATARAWASGYHWTQSAAAYEKIYTDCAS